MGESDVITLRVEPKVLVLKRGLRGSSRSFHDTLHMRDRPLRAVFVDTTSGEFFRDAPDEVRNAGNYVA